MKKQLHYSKKEFEAKVQAMKELSLKSYTSQMQSSVKYEDVYAALAEHDPELARLAKEADEAQIEPMRKLYKYMSLRTEN